MADGSNIWITALEQTLKSTNAPWREIISITDLPSFVSGILTIEDFWDEQKSIILETLNFDMWENDKVEYLLLISPDTSVEQLWYYKELIRFFLDNGFSSNIVSSIDWIDSNQPKLTYLQETDFIVTEDISQDFFNTVIIFLSGWDVSILKSYEKKLDPALDTKTSGATRLSAIGYRDFKKKILFFDPNAKFSPLKKGWYNIKLTKWSSINIWSNCVTWKNIYQAQQQMAIKELWCTREQWLSQ